jgi:RNA polymerase sigma-70 factor, ECF subfamily
VRANVFAPRVVQLAREASHVPDRLLASAIARAKAGDVGALHFLYVRYADVICRHVNGIVRDPHEAEDITQTVFAKLLPAIKKYERRAVPFDAWLMRVARNSALDHLRSKRQIPFAEVRAADGVQEHVNSERLESLRTALDRLPEDQRDVLVLRHIAGLTPREIAVALDRTESSVHGLHHRGRVALKAALRELGAAPVTA